MDKQPFTYNETVVYYVSKDYNYEPQRYYGYWTNCHFYPEHKVFQTTLYNGNKSTGRFDSENQIFSTFEEAKQVGLQQVENQIKHAMDKVNALRANKEKLTNKTKFSYDETEFWVVSEDADMFPYIDSIKLVEGKWLTVVGTRSSKNELLSFHVNDIKTNTFKRTISDDHLFHTFEEAKSHALKLINERQKVMDKKIADKEAELAGFKKLRDNCINESWKYVNTTIETPRVSLNENGEIASVEITSRSCQ